MEVKVKERDYSSPLVHVFFSVMLLCGAVVAISFFQKAEMMKNGWFIYVLAGVFGLFGLTLLIQLFLPPKEFEAELKIKTEQDFMGEIITYMVFEPIIPNNPAQIKKSCPCYTQTPNELVVGRIYRIMVKTYNYKILSILNPDMYAGLGSSQNFDMYAGLGSSRNFDMHAGMGNSRNSYSGVAIGGNTVSDKLLKEKERLLELDMLSKYDFMPEDLKVDMSYIESAKVKLPNIMTEVS